MSKGKAAERAVARWLRENGWPQADRAVRTGYRSSLRTSDDPGDIVGTPGLAWQVKDCGTLTIPAWMAETATQATASGADFGILVVKQRGKASPGRWFAYVTAWEFHILLGGEKNSPTPVHADFPVRMELGELVPLLHVAGYGSATE